MKILILEDNAERIAAFKTAAKVLPADLVMWHNAHKMVSSHVRL